MGEEKMRKEIEKIRNWIIEFETSNEKFYLYQMTEQAKEKHGSYDSYENAEKAIERAETIKKKKIAPLPFINTDTFGNSYKEGMITSIAEEKTYGVYVWVSINKSRSKVNSKLLKDTPENIKVLEKMKELTEAIQTEKEKFVYYTAKELKKHFEVDNENQNN